MNSQFGLARGLAVVCLAALVSAAALVPASAVHDGGLKKGPTLTWRLGQPVSYKNLTIFPVVGRSVGAEADHAYITLDEGIRSGTVVITERGAAAAQAGLMRRRSGALMNQQASLRTDGASVNQLALINRSGKKLLLLAGEVIVGGKQDRIVQDDLIVPPISTPIALDVFCVEHGRWSQRAAGSASSSVGPVIAPATAERREENFYSLGAVAHPKLRAAAQDKKSQSDVWKEVGENNEKLGTKTTTDTYQEVYSSGKVAQSIESYTGALQREVAGPNVVGVVVARNGELVWADVFATPSLFARYWPKLLKSYAVDALADQQSERRPTLDAASRYLYDRAGKSTGGGRVGVFELTKYETPHDALFELWDTSVNPALRVHFNKVQR